ncbi:MAG: type I secretion system permease/ATPase [Snodgrassella sp.]|uniref:type I secretion system permease/ATPase n=1 Tax=Snodgrassella TaxID=1193515 RepID=UPI001EF51402|nr:MULTISPECIES: type I secretion system permease/ATPase [Snodgrassella]MCO6506473.1 type I secretion system permease/ATPase [Snodgrassella sp.]MCO6507561.1 type I secretion system permease/ATPase [Snodgrassella sp.]MCO6521381.1 type I secretion system permease/ATPase [Snodgrassella sp.]MCO6525149.1 type I secretion system permease/ATPase [Snodgrassella sp.]
MSLPPELSIPAEFEKPSIAVSALVLLAHFHGIAVNPADIMHRYAEQNDLKIEQWLLAAKDLGLKAKLVKHDIKRLHLLALPALVWRDDGQHFILARIDEDRYLIQDVEAGKPVILNKEEFAQRYSGQLILVASRASILGQLAKFDFTWFIPAVIKYRRIFVEVLIVSVFIQLFALVTPMFFQVVMDKVLVHRGFSTLDVITIALLVITIFDVVLGGLRTYIFAHTTSRIDVELGARLFRHLLSLPLAYFEHRRVGDTVARVRELEQIRNFLTGQALTSVLDLCFSFIFLLVMWFYSGWLTLVVLVSLPCYAIWSATISPVLRSRLNDKFARNADNQSFLVESVTAIGTIKAMAVEPQMTRRWDQQLAAYVSSGFRVTRLATIGQQGVQLIQKLVTVVTLWLGAHLVIKGELTVGQLIAFNMLAGQVAAPVIRLAQLWQDFQQVGISVSRLGDILNTPTENPTSRMALPNIKGQIEFEKISFRYRPDGAEILRDLNLRIRSGEILGIVGRSGSGKSTLTKLVQRLYTPERGRVLVDGNDLALADPAWLRRQVGVVLQENVLLNQSIRANIALADPGMPLEKIMYAAKMAGAHDFIMELPEGYDTVVGEQGAGLSGGQRQRIAIARALVGNPRILILDEATSALDYESERAIMQNMQAICRGRTVLIIAHRLSTVRMADRIIAMDKGMIVEEGTHQELLAKPDGYYRYLYQLQNS